MGWKIATILFLVVLMSLTSNAAAIEFNQPISAEDKATFDQILTPVMKIYNFVKYAATTIAVIVLLFAGISWIVSGHNPAKRDTAKNMIAYVVIGLAVIWVAPFVVNYIIV